jgi:hypothetical protein
MDTFHTSPTCKKRESKTVSNGEQPVSKTVSNGEQNGEQW